MGEPERFGETDQMANRHVHAAFVASAGKLARLLPELQRQGYRFVTASEVVR